MTNEEMQTLFSQPNNAIVGVNRTDAGPQLTPVWYCWDGKDFYFSTTRDRAKYINIKRNPSISLIVDDFATHKYVVAYGQAEILEQNDSDKLHLILQKYMPAEQVEVAVKRTLDDPSRVLVVLHTEKVVSN